MCSHQLHTVKPTFNFRLENWNKNIIILNMKELRELKSQQNEN